jgi:hypothetical protein
MRFNHGFGLLALAVSVAAQTAPVAGQMSDAQKAAKLLELRVLALTQGEELCGKMKSITENVRPPRRPAVCACFAGGFAQALLLQPQGMFKPNSSELTEDGQAVIRVIVNMCSTHYSKR